jgi:hypothetical protein
MHNGRKGSNQTIAPDGFSVFRRLPGRVGLGWDGAHAVCSDGREGALIANVQSLCLSRMIHSAQH